MLSHTDQGRRPVTPCPNCKRADVTAVVLARTLRTCAVARARFFVIEDRRTVVRPSIRAGYCSSPVLFFFFFFFFFLKKEK